MFNGQRGHVLRSVKLRGQLSQGLIISLLDSGLGATEWRDESFDERLGIQLWERPIPASLAGQIAGSFPTHLFPKTDQERCQNLTDKIFGEWKDLKWEITTKLDGSSCTIAVHDGVQYVCSRNVWLKIGEENMGNSFVGVAKKSGLLFALWSLDSIGVSFAVQGELMGPGIQGNQEQLSHHKLFIYDIYDIKEQRYLDCFERYCVVQQLKDLLVDTDLVDEVPVIEEAVTLARHGIRSLDDLLAFADGPSLNSSVLREGLVFKSQPVGVSFKAISNKWLLGQKD
jgi:RNA ligase (TIGR02306 family)